jgi:hypothetical protein
VSDCRCWCGTRSGTILGPSWTRRPPSLTRDSIRSRGLQDRCAKPHHATPHNATPHHTTTQHTIPHHTTPHHATPHHTTPRTSPQMSMYVCVEPTIRSQCRRPPRTVTASCAPRMCTGIWTRPSASLGLQLTSLSRVVTSRTKAARLYLEALRVCVSAPQRDVNRMHATTLPCLSSKYARAFCVDWPLADGMLRGWVVWQGVRLWIHPI